MRVAAQGLLVSASQEGPDEYRNQGILGYMFIVQYCVILPLICTLALLLWL